MTLLGYENMTLRCKIGDITLDVIHEQTSSHPRHDDATPHERLAHGGPHGRGP